MSNQRLQQFMKDHNLPPLGMISWKVPTLPLSEIGEVKSEQFLRKMETLILSV